MKTQTLSQGRREVAQLLTIVRNHPALPVGIRDGIDDLLSEAQHLANPYDTPEGIEIYLAARSELDRQEYSQESAL